MCIELVLAFGIFIGLTTWTIIIARLIDKKYDIGLFVELFEDES